MSDGERGEPDPGGDFDAEVSDTRTDGAPHVAVGASGGGAADASAGRSPSRVPAPFATRRTPRQRLLRQAGIAATVLLALAIMVSGIPTLRERAIGLIVPPPAPTLVPGSDEFTFLPNPPGVTVSVDGHALAHPPAPGDSHPLRLAPGRHTFAWQSRIYPFVPQSCVASVPPASGDTCAEVDPATLRAQGVPVRGNVLATNASLFTLQANEIAALQRAIMLALAASTSSATVQPGEPYYTLQPSGAGGYTLATQPLRATFSLDLFAPTEVGDPCLLGMQAAPCRFQGQNCGALCTIADPPPSATAGAPDAWIAAVVVATTWTYTTPGGQVVASDASSAITNLLVVLRITWDGATWRVTPILGHTAGLPAADDVACGDTRFWLTNSTWNFMLTDPPGGAAVDFISGATPADGCLAILSRGPGGANRALFLGRFGLLLTLNDTARNPVDGFPQADATDQRIAQSLAARAGVAL